MREKLKNKYPHYFFLISWIRILGVVFVTGMIILVSQTAKAFPPLSFSANPNPVAPNSPVDLTVEILGNTGGDQNNYYFDCNINSGSPDAWCVDDFNYSNCDKVLTNIPQASGLSGLTIEDICTYPTPGAAYYARVKVENSGAISEYSTVERAIYVDDGSTLPAYNYSVTLTGPTVVQAGSNQQYQAFIDVPAGLSPYEGLFGVQARLLSGTTSGLSKCQSTSPVSLEGGWRSKCCSNNCPGDLTNPCELESIFGYYNYGCFEHDDQYYSERMHQDTTLFTQIDFWPPPASCGKNVSLQATLIAWGANPPATFPMESGGYYSIESNVLNVTIECPSLVSGVYWQFSTQDKEEKFILKAQSPIYTVATNKINSTKSLITLTSQGFTGNVKLSVLPYNSCLTLKFDDEKVNINQEVFTNLWVKTTNCNPETMTLTIRGEAESDSTNFATFDLKLGIVTPPAPKVEETTRTPFWRQIIPW